ncbi:hypothetical protein PSYJA_40837, partial [Pseudomonas syringae pv. japonica str. M301072]
EPTLPFGLMNVQGDGRDIEEHTLVLEPQLDLRLRTTSSGLQDVGTRDGLRIIVQAYVAWQVQG